MNAKSQHSLLFAGFVASTGLAFYFTDRAKPHWGIEFWSIVGTNASVLGIFYAIVQLIQIRKEAEIISAASNETKRKLLSLGQFEVASN